MFGRGNKHTKAFLLFLAILPIFNVYLNKNKPYQYSWELYQTDYFILKCFSMPIQNIIYIEKKKWELLGKGTLEEYSSYLSWTWSKSKWENNNGFLIYWCHNPFAIGSRISKSSKFRPRLAGKLNKLGTTKCFYQW